MKADFGTNLLSVHFQAPNAQQQGVINIIALCNKTTFLPIF